MGTAIQQAANSFGLPFGLLASIARAESSFNPKAQSGAGAGGLFQLMPGTARELGVKNIFDPVQSAMGGAKYVSQQMKTFGGNVQAALAAYNWGPSAVQNAMKSYGGNWLAHAPAETQNYVRKILG